MRGWVNSRNRNRNIKKKNYDNDDDIVKTETEKKNGYKNLIILCIDIRYIWVTNLPTVVNSL